MAYDAITMNDIGWYTLGAIAASLTSFGFVPQVVKMWRTKSVKDVSPLSITQFIAGVSLWIIYGIHIKDRIVIIANIVSLIILAAALTVYLRFFKR